MAAPRACEAMQPSHCLETLIAKAMSSLVLVSSAPALVAAPALGAVGQA